MGGQVAVLPKGMAQKKKTGCDASLGYPGLACCRTPPDLQQEGEGEGSHGCDQCLK